MVVTVLADALMIHWRDSLSNASTTLGTVGILLLPKEPINLPLTKASHCLLKRFTLCYVYPAFSILAFFEWELGDKGLMTDRFGSNYTKPRALSSNFKRGIGKEGVGVLPS